MPHPYPLASNWSLGMRRDIDRALLPGGASWNLVDLIPDELGDALVSRFGWQYVGSALAGVTDYENLIYAPVTGGNKLLAVDTTSITPKLWDVNAGTSPGSLTAVCTSSVAYRNVVIFGLDGTANVYTGSGAPSAIAGAPAGQYAETYKDHVLLGNYSGGNPNRLWFSAAGDYTTWDTTNGYINTNGEIVGLACLSNVIIVFHPDTTERIRGSSPPPGTDMSLEPLLDVGCVSSNSVAKWNDRAVWASSQGVYITDGTSWTDLTEVTQMKTYWQALVASALTQGGALWTAAGGVYRNHYIVTVTGYDSFNRPGFVDTLCFDLQREIVWRLSNVNAHVFAHAKFGATGEELYTNQGLRITKLSPMWTSTGTNKVDADSNGPSPIWESPMYQGWDRLHRRWIMSMGKQKWRFNYTDYDLRADAGAPTLTLQYCTTPTGGYTSMSPTLPATSDISRVRRSFSSIAGGATISQMLGVKMILTPGSDPYTNLVLKAVEASFDPIEIGAL